MGRGSQIPPNPPRQTCYLIKCEGLEVGSREGRGVRGSRGPGASRGPASLRDPGRSPPEARALPPAWLLRKAQPAWVSLAASPHSRRWSAQRSGGPSWLSRGAGRPQPPPGEDQRAAPRENLRALGTALMALGLGLKETAVQEPGLPVFFPFQLSSPSLV